MSTARERLLDRLTRWSGPGGEGCHTDVGSDVRILLAEVDTRENTGGRDLTAQDVNNALNAYDNGQDTRTIAADLNRIARGDRPSGAGDMAPPAERRRNGFPDSIWPSPPAAGPRAGDTAPAWPGVRSAEGTCDRIVAEVQRSWPHWSGLHGLTGVDRAIEHAVHITISMLQQDPCNASDAALTQVQAWRSAAGSPTTDETGPDQ